MSKYKEAIVRILKSTIKLPAQITLYSSALLAIAVLHNTDIPPILLPIATALGANALANILERIAKGDKTVTEDDIQSAVKSAIQETNIATLLQQNEKLQSEIGNLIYRQNHLSFAFENLELDLVERLINQYSQWDKIFERLIRQVTAISLQLLRVQRQNAEILNQLSRISQEIKMLSDGYNWASTIENNQKLIIVRPENFLLPLGPNIYKNRFKVVNTSHEPQFSFWIKCLWESTEIEWKDISITPRSNRNLHERVSVGNIVIDTQVIRFNGFDKNKQSTVRLLISEIDAHATITFDLLVKPKLAISHVGTKLFFEFAGIQDKPGSIIIRPDGSNVISFELLENMTLDSLNMVMKRN